MENIELLMKLLMKKNPHILSHVIRHCSLEGQQKFINSEQLSIMKKIIEFFTKQEIKQTKTPRFIRKITYFNGHKYRQFQAAYENTKKNYNFGHLSAIQNQITLQNADVEIVQNLYGVSQLMLSAYGKKTKRSLKNIIKNTVTLLTGKKERQVQFQAIRCLANITAARKLQRQSIEYLLDEGMNIFINWIKKCDPKVKSIAMIVIQNMAITSVKLGDKIFESGFFEKFINLQQGNLKKIIPPSEDSYYYTIASLCLGNPLPNGQNAKKALNFIISKLEAIERNQMNNKILNKFLWVFYKNCDFKTKQSCQKAIDIILRIHNKFKEYQLIDHPLLLIYNALNGLLYNNQVQNELKLFVLRELYVGSFLKMKKEFARFPLFIEIISQNDRIWEKVFRIIHEFKIENLNETIKIPIKIALQIIVNNSERFNQAWNFMIWVFRHFYCSSNKRKRQMSDYELSTYKRILSIMKTKMLSLKQLRHSPIEEMRRKVLPLIEFQNNKKDQIFIYN